MKGLSFFGDNNYRRGGLIAAYHNPRSFTWRWVLTYQWRFPEVWRRPSKWFMASRLVWNSGGETSLCIGPIAFIYQWQRPIWKKEATDETP